LADTGSLSLSLSLSLTFRKVDGIQVKSISTSSSSNASSRALIIQNAFKCFPRILHLTRLSDVRLRCCVHARIGFQTGWPGIGFSTCVFQFCNDKERRSGRFCRRRALQLFQYVWSPKSPSNGIPSIDMVSTRLQPGPTKDENCWTESCW
jgi:hypothetical protein